MRTSLWIICTILTGAFFGASPLRAGGDRDALKANSPILESHETADKRDDEELSKKERKKYEQALKSLRSAVGTKKIVRATLVLREGFPRSRSFILKAMKSRSVKVRALAVKIVGEVGDPEADLEIAAQALTDSAPAVRLAAVMAIRKLGPGGANALRTHLGREIEPNIRKMVVKTFRYWLDPTVVPFLIEHLCQEKHPGVRRFTLTALEFLSRKKLGNDVDAWKKYATELVEREQKRRILQYAESMNKKRSSSE